MSTLDLLSLPTEVAGTYRARDIEMAATVDVKNRLVLLTGAIDSSAHTIVVRVELPTSGRWQVVKAETNLTATPWKAWQIRLGEGTRICTDNESRNICRQFSRLHVDADRERLVFFDGCIRPGESILKMFTVDTAVSRIVMAHDRIIEEEETEEVEFPVEPVPTPVDDPSSRSSFDVMIRDGFTSDSVIEVFVPVTLV
jgi:Family of unknown function (DUF6423)